MTSKAVRRVTIVLAGLCVLVTDAAVRAQNQNRDLLDAARRDDTRAVQSLLKGGADPNARDESGATALMQASAVASGDTVRALLEAGADVNASSKSGASALMWATGDSAKVRLLLDRGAAVNARMKDGTTVSVVT
ncbi:MAG: ankyrin repeat domain-containing protein [Acidobacteriota bacterium]